MTTAVYLEVGQRRVFASALEWPGWTRAGKTEDAALQALAGNRERYAPVVREAGLAVPEDLIDDFAVVERVPGSASTEFGVLGEIANADRKPLSGAQAGRLAALISASWKILDRVIAGSPAELRKGPRGGGRDRDKMVRHVIEAEASYGRQLGVRHPPPDLDDAEAIAALRADLVAAIDQPWDVVELAATGWPPRYAARRIAWHVLDHAWEMEDRRERGS